MNRFRIFVAAAILIVMATGCSHMSAAEQRVLSGGALGAGTGAAIGAITGGSILLGTAIGAGAGAVGGLVYDEMQKKK
ncbi:MAG TPA: glycine zipper domain-containing protein [Syntrophorhabdaceae bacterium]|nr:glycine zipper domain-containing protein [Syntrophorhabdaceae bacterium]HQM82882.1 glycine zipper domain-containing protein [Syntrophorhabdaceae bacterium]